MREIGRGEKILLRATREFKSRARAENMPVHARGVRKRLEKTDSRVIVEVIAETSSPIVGLLADRFR